MTLYVFLVALLPLFAGVDAADNGLAITPPLGWRSWNKFGFGFTQQEMMSQATAIAESREGHLSLRDVGYARMGVDMGWEGCGKGLNGTFHNASGWPLVNTNKFPNLTSMNVDLHSMNLKTGFYFNPCWCSVEWKTWPHGNPLQDVATTLELGFDGIKIDGCGPANDMILWGKLLNASSRPLLIEDCLDKHFWGDDIEPPTPTAQILRDCPGNFYRTTTDIIAHFYSIMGNLITSAAFVKNHEADYGPVSRPGCWAYPDMLQVGIDITLEESYTHFAAWCITSAPLILGFDMTNTTVYDEMYPIVTNPRALEINRAWAGHPGGLAASAAENFTTHSGTTTVTSFPFWQVWHKPLNPKQGKTMEAVLVINLSEQTRNVTLTYAEVEPKLGDNVKATDVWTGKPVDTGVKTTVFSLAPHASQFLTLQSV